MFLRRNKNEMISLSLNKETNVYKMPVLLLIYTYINCLVSLAT